MPYDDSFLEKEAAKRRAMNWILILILVNFVVLGVLFATGFLHREPTISHTIIVCELLVCGVLYFWTRKKYGVGPKKK